MEHWPSPIKEMVKKFPVLVADKTGCIKDYEYYVEMTDDRPHKGPSYSVPQEFVSEVQHRLEELLRMENSNFSSGGHRTNRAGRALRRREPLKQQHIEPLSWCARTRHSEEVKVNDKKETKTRRRNGRRQESRQCGFCRKCESVTQTDPTRKK